MDTNRAKVSGIQITITDGAKQKIGSYLIVGTICVVYGIGIYYLLPLSLLTGNLTLVLYVFFFILMGMILGLVLLAFNFQKMIEIFLTYLLFFWERKSMKLLIIKNLDLHRQKNKMTAIIYSLTLGTIIFILVTLSLQIQQLTATSSMVGTDVEVKKNAGFRASDVDLVLKQYEDDILDFGFVALPVTNQNTTKFSSKVYSDSRIYNYGERTMGVQPSKILE